MSTLVCLLLLGATAPEISSGPELAGSARTVEAPIAEVTVFSDRARVHRRGKVQLAAGNHVLLLPDLPGAVMMNSIRVTADPVRVLRVETAPVERERMSIDQVEELITRLEKLGDELARLEAEKAALDREMQLLSRLTPSAPVAEKERVGQPLPPINLPVWSAVLDFLTARRTDRRAALRALDLERKRLGEELVKVQREVARYDLGAFSDHKVQVLAILEAPGATSTTLELSYFVPGASWWPAYDLHYATTDSKIALKTSGLVRQATGESWDRVELHLSTAIPGQSIDLPELLTWTLGEKREFIPRPRPEKPMKQPPRFGGPAPQPLASEADRAARLEVLQQRLAYLNQLASAQAAALAGMYDSGGVMTGDMGADDDAFGTVPGSSVVLHNSRSGKKSAEAYAPPPRAPPAEEPPANYDERYEPMPSVDMEESAAPGRGGGRSRSRSPTSSEPPVQRTSLGLYDPTTWQRPRFSDPTLPAVIAGGLDYVFRAPTPATVPSDGERLRVPLSAETWDASTMYEATPVLRTTAYLRAIVKNDRKTPILSGPVNIFVAGDFIGDGTLETTGPGGELSLPLGGDENIRIVHHVAPTTRTDGFIVKKEITEYATTIEVANHKRRAVRIDVFDVLPMTDNEEMKVTLGKTSPGLAGKPGARGQLRWQLDIAPGKKRTITYQYSVERPLNWQLRQR